MINVWRDTRNIFVRLRSLCSGICCIVRFVPLCVWIQWVNVAES